MVNRMAVNDMVIKNIRKPRKCLMCRKMFITIPQIRRCSVCELGVKNHGKLADSAKMKY